MTGPENLYFDPDDFDEERDFNYDDLPLPDKLDHIGVTLMDGIRADVSESRILRGRGS
jgi:hypothetical protein